MKITQINTLAADAATREMQAATSSQKNAFVFQHRLANGELRYVEVFSYPVPYLYRDVLFSIVHDITAEKQLQAREQRLISLFAAAGSAAIGILLLLLWMVARSNQKLLVSKKEIENYNKLRQAFIDADDALIYLKDQDLKYVFVNRAFEEFHKMKAEEIIGRDDFDLVDNDFALKRRKTDLAVLDKQVMQIDELEWQNSVYQTTKFPIQMLDGKVGVGAYVHDITAEREREKRQRQLLARHMILADVLTRSFADQQQQLDYVLQEALKLTESQCGYIYLYSEKRRQITLMSATAEFAEHGGLNGKLLDKIALWGEAVRQRQPVVVNDFTQPHSLQRGYQAANVDLFNFMSVPLLIDGSVVAVAGLGNRPGHYNDNDVYEITLLMSGVWHALERRNAQEKLIYERNKYLQVLLSIDEGVMMVDKAGKVEMLNAVAQRLTGWTLEEALHKHYKEVFTVAHEADGLTIHDPIADAMATGQTQQLDSEAVLISREGVRYNLEDSAAPVHDETGAVVGVVVVFRDVTERRGQMKKVEYLSFHDSLTGLYNRRFFEQELHRLDVTDNLPISIIMGDVNGLKLTNDVFGHGVGDMLLQKVAAVFRRVGRPGDVIARWGGDEFVMLLPHTNAGEARHIMERIKGEVAKEQIKAIKASLSMGLDTKVEASEDIAQVLSNAEQHMYMAKTLEHDEVSTQAIDAIINLLHSQNEREKEHSILVSELCQEIGRALGLPEVEIRKLKDVGYLHDIGKIILDTDLLNKNYPLDDEELAEMKRHATVGYRILNSFDFSMDLAEAVLAHHERWDGTGYPKGLKGEEIPLVARIIAIAESYDRMIHDTHNRPGMSKEEALRIIKEESGAQFDPALVDLFIQLMSQ
jgi:diguanylate cyclase (GGDEF)-like protein/PAS domain S-box-containing protein/putative nucleotidyltransferase with HDIG domain